MASVYCYKRPITNTGALTYETKTVEQWTSNSASIATLVFEDTNGDLHDYSEYVAELQIQHNDIDGEKAGRDKNTGNMVRVYKINKHTLNVKMVNNLSQAVANKLFDLIHTTHAKQSFYVRYQSPCANGLARKNVYCSTINYGVQRYDRNTGKCYYDGMNYNLIEM